MKLLSRTTYNHPGALSLMTFLLAFTGAFFFSPGSTLYPVGELLSMLSCGALVSWPISIVHIAAPKRKSYAVLQILFLAGIVITILITLLKLIGVQSDMLDMLQNLMVLPVVFGYISICAILSIDHKRSGLSGSAMLSFILFLYWLITFAFVRRRVDTWRTLSTPTATG